MKCPQCGKPAEKTSPENGTCDYGHVFNLEGAFSTGLTKAQTERLAVLAEEAGEVVQVVGKILRHGLDSYHPQSGIGNRALLTKELGDLALAMDMVIYGDLSIAEISKAKDAKRERIHQYLHHQ